MKRGFGKLNYSRTNEFHTFVSNDLNLRSIALILFLLLSNAWWTQNPYSFSIDKTNGLPSNSVFDVYQDSKGFMWFATGKGLCRYDGTNMKHYSNENQTSKSGSCIAEDKMGRIWYENFDGYLYYIENNELKSFTSTESSGYYRYGIINNSIFILQPNSIKIVDVRSLKVKKTIPVSYENVSFTFATEKAFYVLEKSLNVYEESGKKTIAALPAHFSKNFPSPIVQKYGNGIIICSKFNPNYLIFENGKFSSFTINHPIDFIQNCATYGKEIWFCTPKGILKVNPSTTKVAHYFKENTISYIFKDKHNSYWVSTINEGLFFIENFNTQLFPLENIPFSVTNDGENLVIGTERDELLEFNINTKKVKTVFKGNSNLPASALFVNPSSKLTCYNSSKFRAFQKGILTFEQALSVKYAFQLDEKYIVFAATNNSGFLKINAQAKSDWDVLIATKKDENKKRNALFNTVSNANGKATTYNPENKTIYFATNQGLIAQTKAFQKEILYQNKPVYFIRLMRYKNLVYALSSNEELYVIDAQNSITPFIVPKALAQMKVEFIKVQQEYLYIFTEIGVFEYNLETQNIQTVLPLTEDINVSDLSLLDNKIYFATSKGILIKDRLLKKEPITSKLIVNITTLNDKPFDFKTTQEVSYKENNLRIDFSILSFIPNTKNVLLYKINNSKWYRLEPNSQILNLYALSPDDYTILLKVEGETSQKPISIVFTITNPFWNTNLFIVFVILAGFSLIYFLYHIKLNEIKRKNQLILDKINLEKNLNQSKLKAIKSQMNPHFFYNALNTLQSYILSNEKKEAINYLSKFSNLTRTILEMTEKETVSVSEEVKTLSLYLDIEQVRFEKDFSYRILVEPEIDAENIKIPAMLLQPYVENAVKHGLLHKQGEKTLAIHIEKKVETIKISIDDNGIGRQKSNELNQIKNKRHTSFSTAATQKRIDLLNQFTHKNISIHYIDKTNTSHQATGTTVVFEIPITY